MTCLALSDNGDTLVTGSRDTTVMVWKLDLDDKLGQPVITTPKHVLYGHDDEVQVHKQRL